MTEPDGYQHGVPCWVDTWQPDIDRAVAYYTALFSWEAEETSPPGAERRHFMMSMRGRRVTGIGSPPPIPGHTPVWGTYVWVDDVDETVAKAREAGGKVILEPFDALDGGRLALLADPSGGVIAAWQVGENKGAQIVNEPSAWSMSALRTNDLARAARFYGEVFGWETESFGPATMCRLPGYVGGEPSQPVPRDVVAVLLPADADAPAVWGVDFWIDDVERGVADVRRLGGSVLAGPYDAPPSFRQAVVADPGGAAFSISQLVAG
jgi:uncharacterized protein